MNELYETWHRAVLSAAKALFREHDLDLVPRTGRGRLPYEFKVRPLPGKSWEDAADKIRKTINGVGDFYYGSLREYLKSGPYTAREAVLSDLHWIESYPDVYGTKSAKRMYEQMWR